MGALVSLPGGLREQRNVVGADIEGLDLRAINDMNQDDDAAIHSLPLRYHSHSLLSAPFVLMDVDLALAAAGRATEGGYYSDDSPPEETEWGELPARLRNSVSVETTVQGTLDALALWVEYGLDDDVNFADGGASAGGQFTSGLQGVRFLDGETRWPGQQIRVTAEFAADDGTWAAGVQVA